MHKNLYKYHSPWSNYIFELITWSHCASNYAIVYATNLNEIITDYLISNVRRLSPKKSIYQERPDKPLTLTLNIDRQTENLNTIPTPILMRRSFLFHSTSCYCGSSPVRNSQHWISIVNFSCHFPNFLRHTKLAVSMSAFFCCLYTISQG